MREIETLTPAEIEARSFAIIAKELEEAGIILPEEQAPVIQRAIHTTADLDYAKTLCFSEGVVPFAKQLLQQGCMVVTDTNMALTGINKTKLAAYGGEVVCRMADAEVAEEAGKRGTTRAAVSMERAAKEALASRRPTIFAIGNAPTALLTLWELWQTQQYTPDLIIAVPVGFVHVEEAKERIISMPVPSIVNRGRKGGSNVAAAIVNALLYEIEADRK